MYSGGSSAEGDSILSAPQSKRVEETDGYVERRAGVVADTASCLSFAAKKGVLRNEVSWREGARGGGCDSRRRVLFRDGSIAVE